MALSGAYEPLTLDDAVKRSANVLMKFIQAGVKVIRICLCASENLSSCDTYFAGPNHPALGELVENEIYYKLISKELSSKEINRNNAFTVFVPRGALSKAIGQKSRNKNRLLSDFALRELSFVEDDKICAYSVRVTRKERINDVFKKS